MQADELILFICRKSVLAPGVPFVSYNFPWLDELLSMVECFLLEFGLALEVCSAQPRLFLIANAVIVSWIG